MSSFQEENLSRFLVTEESNYILKPENVPDILKDLKNTINSLELFIIKNANSDINIKINDYFVQINVFLDKLKNIINSNINQNESIIKKHEQKIRNLYSNIFNQKLMNEVLENKVSILHKKEKEYELLKQKTGAIVCNGQVICNERKDNEIIILRTENSLLKSAIKNNEDLLKEKNEIINSLNNDILIYKSQIDELHKNKHGKYSSFSNINININETKKDLNQKNNIPKKPFGNTIQVFSSTKKNPINNQDIKIKNYKNINNKRSITNKNGINNIYSSYQINSQLINKINKNGINNYDEVYKTNNISKNNFKNETMENNKTFSIKYISVNKSLFTPKNTPNQNYPSNNSNIVDKKTFLINRIKKSKIVLNNNLSNREYNIFKIDPQDIKNEVKVKKISKYNNIKHKKSNSNQNTENSIKNLMHGIKKELSLEKNNSNLYSVIKKINQFKNNTTKNSNSLPASIIHTFSEGFTKNKSNNNSQKYLNCFLNSYADRRNERGRNEISKLVNDSFKDNSLSFLQKTFLNKTSIENSNNDRNNNNVIYNHSIEISKDLNPNFRK